MATPIALSGGDSLDAGDPVFVWIYRRLRWCGGVAGWRAGALLSYWWCCLRREMTLQDKPRMGSCSVLVQCTDMLLRLTSSLSRFVWGACLFSTPPQYLWTDCCRYVDAFVLVEQPVEVDPSSIQHVGVEQSAHA